MEEAFMTEFSNCSTLEEQVFVKLSYSSFKSFYFIFWRLSCFTKTLKYLEWLRSASSWKRAGKMRKRQKRWTKNFIKIEIPLLQGKEQGNVFFQKGKNIDALKHYNRCFDCYLNLNKSSQGSSVSSRGESCPTSPVCESLGSFVQDEQIHRLCGGHWRSSEVGLPWEPQV